MNILLTGANGFIGSHIAAALQAAGHSVQAATRAQGVDFLRDTKAAAWLPRLQNMDAVINAVGVLRDTGATPMQAIHVDSPCALFDACTQAGVHRVLHISALGIQLGDFPYASSKRAADEHLLGLHESGRVNASILRPSVVFGRDRQGRWGDSSALFMNLAKLPLLLLPQPVQRARVQPLAVAELAECVAKLVSHTPPVAAPAKPLLEIAGPRALTIAALVASLRQQLGKSAAQVWPLPQALTHLSARMGDFVSIAPWCSETLAMLATDNVADYQTFRQLLGREATAPEGLLGGMASN